MHYSTNRQAGRATHRNGTPLRRPSNGSWWLPPSSPARGIISPRYRMAAACKVALATSNLIDPVASHVTRLWSIRSDLMNVSLPYRLHRYEIELRRQGVAEIWVIQPRRPSPPIFIASYKVDRGRRPSDRPGGDATSVW